MLTAITGHKLPPPNLEVFVESGGVKCAGDALYSFSFWKRQNVFDERTEKIQMTILEIIHKSILVTQHIATIMVCEPTVNSLIFYLLTITSGDLYYS